MVSDLGAMRERLPSCQVCAPEYIIEGHVHSAAEGEKWDAPFELFLITDSQPSIFLDVFSVRAFTSGFVREFDDP